jgi:peptide chain release factor 1
MDQTEIDNLLKQVDLNKITSEIHAFENQTDTDYSSKDYIDSLKKYNKNLEIKDLHNQILSILSNLKDTKELAQDEALKEQADNEIALLEENLANLYTKLELLLIEPLENDDKKALFEIRPGVGGVEAALFANDLLEMYQKYCLKNNLKIEIYSIDYNLEGGINEAVFLVDSENSYSTFRFESGVHRVQRVPKTETLGRIHTSTASVVVMPEIDLNTDEISPNDLRIDVYRSSGPGGQSVNTTDSAVRITHIPTKITVTSQASKSQHKNKDVAMKILASRLYELEAEKISSQVNALRSESIMGGKRSSKIRTYNFPQGRITDHRIGKSWFNIEEVVYEGALENILETTNQIIRTGKSNNTEDNEE